MEVLLVTLVFTFALDTCILFLLYKNEIVKKNLILIPALWHKTKKVIIYFFIVGVFLYLNIPFIVVTYLRYSEDRLMQSLMFLISMMYIVLTLGLKNTFLRHATKNYNMRK